MVSTFVPYNLGICANLRLYCVLSESGNCMPISRLHTKFTQLCAISRLRNSVACTIEPKLSFKFSSCTKVRNVRKELLQLHHHHQCQACIQDPHQRLLGSLPTRQGETHIVNKVDVQTLWWYPIMLLHPSTIMTSKLNTPTFRSWTYGFCRVVCTMIWNVSHHVTNVTVSPWCIITVQTYYRWKCWQWLSFAVY